MKWAIPLLFLLTISILIPLAKSDIHYNANTYPFTFPTYGTAMGFDTDMTFTTAYRVSDYWYFTTATVTEIGFQVQVATLLITDFFVLDANTLYFTVTAPSGTSTTKINVGIRGSPISVVGSSSWSYDSGTHIATISRVHSSSAPYTIVVSWSGSDTTPPTYSNIAHNTTMENQPCQFSVKWQDNVALSGSIFSWNGTGAWTNNTWTALSGNPAWANTTKTLPTSGTIVGYKWYCNDTSNNWATTPISDFTTTVLGNNVVVLLGSPSDGATVYSKSQTFTYTPIFYQSIENASLWLNLGGTWQSVMWNTTTIQNNTLNSLTYSFSSSATYIWNVRAFNSTMGIFAVANRTLIVSLEPYYTELGASPQGEGEVSTLYSRWKDGDGLSGYIACCNITGAFVNETWGAFGGSPLEALASMQKTLPTHGIVIRYLFYVNDTDNLWSVTAIGSFTVEPTVPLAPDFSSWWQWLAEGDLLGFIQGIYVMAFSSVDIFFALVAMLGVGAIYIRTRSLILMSILWLLVGGFLILAMPLVAGLGVLLMIFGVAGLLYQLFKPHSYSY